MRRKLKNQTYYSVFTVKDGTIWHAATSRKPDGSLADAVDEDGVFNTFVEELGAEARYTRVAKVVRGATLATSLNLRRVLRDRVENRLIAVTQQLASLRAQADRIEAALKEVLVIADRTPRRRAIVRPSDLSG